MVFAIQTEESKERKLNGTILTIIHIDWPCYFDLNGGDVRKFSHRFPMIIGLKVVKLACIHIIL